jgi:hypothetical protein
VKFPEKGLSTMAAIWPSTERVNANLKLLFIFDYKDRLVHRNCEKDLKLSLKI